MQCDNSKNVEGLSVKLFYDLEFLGPFWNNFAAKYTNIAVKYRTSMAIHVFLYNILHKS